MKITLLSSKGQITIPRTIQKTLRIGHRSKLALYPQKGVLIVKPLQSSIVEQTAGSLSRYISPHKRGIPFKKVREETQKLVAKELAEKGNNG